ncbi:MAG: hypothetical protein DRP15_00810 [Candidatus Aenigmatarchaeota archaeon]|nr:MAG: hypothetical protein DRP15_00810 [Candidatus Aenigmarchaeota archaeon]
MCNWSKFWSRFVEITKKIDLNGTTYMFEYYKHMLGDFSFKNKKVLELGCGTGINSILMASLGAKVTVVDYSREALNIVKKLSDGLNIELVHRDIFEWDIENEFDLVHSEGVVEHFLMPKRQEIIDIHTKSAKRNGKVLIIVPNAECPPYRIGKKLAEISGRWVHGNEYPYTKKELMYRMKKSGLLCERFMGGEFLISLGWLFAPLWLHKYSNFLEKGLSMSVKKFFYNINYGNFFANRWGRAIAVLGRRIH